MVDAVQNLKYIAEKLIQSDDTVNSPGLLYGNIGFVIFFFHYSNYTGDKTYEERALLLLDRLIEQVQQEYVVDYADGLAGIGAGIEYLVQYKFIEADTHVLLKNFDETIFSATIHDDQTNTGLFTGLTGLGRYALFRML